MKRLEGWVPIGLVLLMAAVLRLLYLGHENFWIDEVYQIGRARTPATFPTKFLQLVPSYLALRLGESEFLFRLPSALFGVADVGVLYLLTRRMYPERTAVLAALLLALSPLHIWYAQEARWYAQWSLVTVLSYLMLLRGLQTGEHRAWTAYGALAAFNLYLFLLSIFVCASQALSAAVLFVRRRYAPALLLKLCGAIAVAALVALPLLLRALSWGGSTSTGTPRPTTLAVLPYTFFTYVAGFSVGPTVRELHFISRVTRLLQTYPEILYYFAVLGPLALVGLWRAVRSESPRPALLLPWLLGLPLLVFLAGTLTPSTYNVRYTFAALPAFTILLALGVEGLRAGWPRWTALLAVVLGFGFSLHNYYLNPRYDKEDVRGAVRHIRSSDRPEAPVYYVGQVRPALDYYGTDVQTVRLVRCDSGIGEVAMVPDRPIRPDEDLWFAVARDWNRRGPECLEWLSRTHKAASRVGFTGVELVELTPRRPTDPRSAAGESDCP